MSLSTSSFASLPASLSSTSKLSLGGLLHQLHEAEHLNTEAPVTAVLKLEGDMGPQSPGYLTHLEISEDSGLFGSTVVFHIKFDSHQANYEDLVALQVCQLMGFVLSGSPNRWAWRRPGTDDETLVFHESKLVAAQATVQKCFLKSSWLYEVNNNTTQLGYMKWALKQAMLVVAEREC